MTKTHAAAFVLALSWSIAGCNKSSTPANPVSKNAPTGGDDTAGPSTDVEQPAAEPHDTPQSPNASPDEAPADGNPFAGPGIELTGPANGPLAGTDDRNAAVSDPPADGGNVIEAESGPPKPSLEAVFGSVGRALTAQSEEPGEDDNRSIFGVLGRALGKGIEEAAGMDQ